MLTPLATAIGGNKYLKAVSSGFVAIMAASIVGSLFTLLANLPITSYTTWLSTSGFGAILNLPAQATIDLISLYAVFFISYSLAKEFNVDGGGAGLAALVSFMLVTGRTTYFTSAAADAASATAYATGFLGARGLFTAMIVGLLSARIYVFVVKKGWVIKLPDSVPPNVANSFSSLIPVAIIISIWLVVTGLMASTSFGSLHALIFNSIQNNLMRFMGNNIFSAVFFTFMSSLLWFFGLHGGNLTGAITNPIYTPLSLENFAAYQAGLPMPYIINANFSRCFTQGGVGSMFSLAILMVLFAKSKQFKILGRISLPTTFFFINEPLLFGIPVVLNVFFFLPLLLITPILSVLTYTVMSLGIIPPPNGAQIPWTTPPILYGILQGSWKIAVWEFITILLSGAMWFPFFKISDQRAYEAEQAEDSAAAGN
jgi:PTS system cellobiose-specific IIC component